MLKPFRGILVRGLFAVLFIAAVMCSRVVAAAQIEGLQPPAWIEHAGQLQPARPGMTVGAPDMLSTGKGGRLLIRLADGSFVKLGAGARLSLESLQEETTTGGVFRGVLNVLRGAFRYTAGTLAHSFQRDLQVRLLTTTVGIRGTDVWGRSEDGGVTVCLIEGKVSVRHPAREELMLDKPLEFFVAPKDAPPKPVGKIDPAKLKQWAAATDLSLGQGVILPGGSWIVQLSSHQNEQTARRIEARLLKDGIPVEFTTVQLRDRTFHRLQVIGFDTQQDARTFVDRIQGIPGIGKPFVTCNIPGTTCR